MGWLQIDDFQIGDLPIDFLNSLLWDIAGSLDLPSADFVEHSGRQSDPNKLVEVTSKQFPCAFNHPRVGLYVYGGGNTVVLVVKNDYVITHHHI